MRLAVFVAMAILLFDFNATSASIKFDSLQAGSRIYHNVTVLSLNETDVYFSHSEGMANAKLRLLPPEAQKALGYDPGTAARIENKREAENELYQSNVRSRIERAAQATLPGAGARRSSEKNISDPISDKSLIGKSEPKIDFKLWPDLGDAACSGKHILLVFWAAWSVPSVNSLATLAGFQKSFPNNLLVLGVKTGPEQTAGSLENSSPDFPNTVDTTGKLAAAAGVTSVPFVLLISPEGVVLYQGHPAALTQGGLSNLFAGTGERSGSLSGPHADLD